MSRLKVAVAVADDARERIYEVAAACRALGLDHTRTHALAGLLMGSIESGGLARLLTVPGVLTVEIDHGFCAGIVGTVQ